MTTFAKLPNWLRAGLATSFFVAVPGFLLSLVGWLEELAEWAAGDALAFPDLSALRRAAVALVLAVVLGAVNAFVRWVQERAQDSTGPVAALIARTGSPPVYPTVRRSRPLHRGDTLED